MKTLPPAPKPQSARPELIQRFGMDPISGKSVRQVLSDRTQSCLNDARSLLQKTVSLMSYMYSKEKCLYVLCINLCFRELVESCYQIGIGFHIDF